jgi:accessory colonization factor AcfC
MSSLSRFFATIALASAAAQAQTVINVYGPGGPAPAMQEAAKAFGATAGVTVSVTAGPTPQWVEKAKGDADVIYSGAENMMTDFARALPGAFDLKEVYPLYLRPIAILVRPGNPKNIRGLRDLLAPGIKVLTVAGAGQVGVWEDVAGRTGDIELVRALRRNIVFPEAVNSGAAKEQWTQQADLDAWLIWNIWQVANPQLAEVVPMDERHRIYRDTGVVLTQKGKTMPQAAAFIEFLKSEQGQQIFTKWGWDARRGGTPGNPRPATSMGAPEHRRISLAQFAGAHGHVPR